MKNIKQEKGGKMDRFLRSVLEPAADEYLDGVVFCAKHPESTIPPHLDKKCRDIIAGKPCCLLKSIIKVIMVAAVSVSMMAASSFAVYTGVKQGLLMKLETEPEGSRISFAGEDVEPAPALSTPGKIQLSYIPDGFECVYRDDETIIYLGQGGNNIVVDQRKIFYRDVMLWDTENAVITAIEYNGYDGYKSIGRSVSDDRQQVSFLWFDTEENVAYRIITLGLTENETIKIMEGIKYESKPY